MAGIVKKCPCLRPKIEEEIRVLDYRHSSLHDVPSEVFNLERTLEELYCDSNQIRDLPRELFYCHGLRKLSISDNEITSIPPAVSSLANLEELDFSKNGIIDVPENIKGCKYLRSVDASVNPLGKLPEGFTQLANLTHLFLNDTFLDYLPGSFGRMTKLRILEMRENHLKTLPRSFNRLISLERLDLGNNELTELPDVIGSLTNLLELWCDHNQITSITHTIGNLKQLMFMDASKNLLQELPGELEGCHSLADLHLTSNNLLSLPDSLGNLTHLTTLKADDNQLTSLPKTLGGLASLSELNVSTNDLQDLPVSIGLLRNLRTFYADENILEYVPAELGSCSGITVLSLRSNKLTYIPDELGRIPRLRVLNLSDNILRYLPFTIVKLKELQALWLTENQTRPLIPLQSEYEADTGRKILTCYLLPQGEMAPNDERDPTGDNESFHASMWDEERGRRQQIQFDFVEDSDEEGRLVRCPTPYPKEMREKVRHARNLAMRQMIRSPDTQKDGTTGGVHDNTDKKCYDENENTQTDYGFNRVPSGSERMREAKITNPSGPKFQESHRLYRFDKEKLQKDKARMNRLSVPDETEVCSERGRDKKKGTSSKTNRSGSVPDLNRRSSKDEVVDSANVTVSVPYSATFEDLYNNQIVSHGSSRRRRRVRDYESDTGYRSDKSSHLGKGGSSDVLSVRSQPLPHNHRGHRHRRRDLCSDNASDIEFRRATAFATANEAAAAFQKRHDQYRLGQQTAQSLPHNLNNPSASPYTPRSLRHSRPTTPSKSENQIDIRTSDCSGVNRNNSNNVYDVNSTRSNEDYYKISQTKESQPTVRFRNKDSIEIFPADEPIISDNKSHSTFQTSNNRTSSYDNLHPQTQQVSSDFIYEKSRNFDPAALNKPAVAPKPVLSNLSGSNQSLSHTSQLPASSGSVLQNDNFSKEAPYMSQLPVPGGISPTGTPGRERRAPGLYTLIEERGGLPKNLPSQTPSQTTVSATPPPYQPAPPYRRSNEMGRTTPRCDSRLSSDSASSRVDSPRITTTNIGHITSLNNPQTHSIQANLMGSGSNLNRSRSSPCGFHGSDPYSDLPQSREKLSYSDYADLDRHSIGSRHGSDSAHITGSGDELGGYRDNYTSRSCSSSSQIGSASQVAHGYTSHGGASGGALIRDRSNSSDSRTSDFHIHSTSQDSPRIGSVFGSGRGSRRSPSRHARVSFDPSSGAHVSYDSSHYEDLTLLPNQEQSSQVSSSTDSGYSHGHHVYERIGDMVNSRGEGFTSTGRPGSLSSGATSTPPLQRQTLIGQSPLPSRELTPVIDQTSPDSTSQDLRDEMWVTINKNPGLGFSIAGGIGSHGNPYRPNDKGIFVTKVTPNGPASQTLRPGDKLLEANKVDFRNIDHNQAVTTLKNSSSVHLHVERIHKVNMV